MRYVIVLSFLIALAVVVSLTATRLTRSASGPSSYDAAVGAGHKAAGAAEQRVKDILQTTEPARP